jgi:hypothetical protein
MSSLAARVESPGMRRRPKAHRDRFQAFLRPWLAADQLVTQARERVRLKGCGRQADTVPLNLRLDEPSSWMLTLDGTELAGSYVARGRRDRKLLLETDEAGVAALAARAAARATAVCGAETGVDAVTAPDFGLLDGCCTTTCVPVDSACQNLEICVPADCGQQTCDDQHPCCDGYSCIPTCNFDANPFCTSANHCQR